MIKQSESAPFRVHVAFVQLSRNGNISDGRVHPAPAIHLKYTTCRYRTDCGKIPRTTRINVMRTVEAPHHVRIAKGADQSLCDTIILYGRQCGVGRLHFTAIGKFKAAKLQTGVVSFQTHESLLRKDK